MSTSVAGIPQSIISLINYSITTDTLSSPFNSTLFPDIKAPITYKVGISSGKLKGLITATGPNGNL